MFWKNNKGISFSLEKIRATGNRERKIFMQQQNGRQAYSPESIVESRYKMRRFQAGFNVLRG